MSYQHYSLYEPKPFETVARTGYFEHAAQSHPGNCGARDVAAQAFEFLALMLPAAHPGMQAEAVRIGAQGCSAISR